MEEGIRQKSKVVILNRNAAETILELLQLHNVKRPSESEAENGGGPSKRVKAGACSSSQAALSRSSVADEFDVDDMPVNDGLDDAARDADEVLTKTSKTARRKTVSDDQVNEIMTDFWQRVMLGINTLTFEEMRKPELPVGRVKKVLKFEENLTMVSGTVSIMLAKAAEILAAELTQRGYLAMMRSGRRTVAKEHIAQGTHGVDHLDFLLDFLPQEAGQARAAAGSAEEHVPEEMQHDQSTVDLTLYGENSNVQAELQSNDSPEESMQDTSEQHQAPVMLNVKRKLGTNAEAIQVAQGCLRDIQSFLQESMGLRMAGNAGKLLETTGIGLLPSPLDETDNTNRNSSPTRSRLSARRKDSTAATSFSFADLHDPDEDAEVIVDHVYDDADQQEAGLH